MPGIPGDINLSTISPPIVKGRVPPLIDTSDYGMTGYREDDPVNVDGDRWPHQFLGNVVMSCGFENGNKTPEVNSIGFNFHDTTIASVVEGNTVVYDHTGPVNEKYPNQDWEALTGTHCLRLRSAAGSNWPEQKFEWAEENALHDLWIGFNMRVPTNFEHQEMPGGALSNNQKLLRLYTATSKAGAGLGGAAGLSFRRATAEGGVGNSVWFGKVFDDGTPAADRPASPHAFITIPGDLGRWMRVVVHAKCSTSKNGHDAIFEVYRKWESESAFTKVIESTDTSIAPNDSGAEFFSGYLLGYQNAPYDVDTDFLFDNFEIGEGVRV